MVVGNNKRKANKLKSHATLLWRCLLNARKSVKPALFVACWINVFTEGSLKRFRLKTLLRAYNSHGNIGIKGFEDIKCIIVASTLIKELSSK